MLKKIEKMMDRMDKKKNSTKLMSNNQVAI